MTAITRSTSARYAIRDTRSTNKGFTLIEVLMAIVLIAAIMYAAVAILRAVLATWSSQRTRAGVYVPIDRGINMMARELREATAVSDNSHNHEIRFAVKRRDASGNTINDPLTGNPYIDYYVYYFYGSGPARELRRSALTPVPAGSSDLTAMTYAGSAGSFIAAGITAYPTSDMAVNGNVVTMDFSVTGNNETARSRTDIRPRNFQ